MCTNYDVNSLFEVCTALSTVRNNVSDETLDKIMTIQDNLLEEMIQSPSNPADVLKIMVAFSYCKYEFDDLFKKIKIEQYL